jgi:hypothetical protein
VAEGPRGGSRAEKKDVKPGESITLTLAPLGTLTGHLLAGSAPVKTYDLACGGPAGRVDRRIQSDDGAYSLEHLAPGSYDCEASTDGGTADGKVDVPAGSATLELKLAPWASIAGTAVSVLTGKPVPGLVAVASSGGYRDQMVSALFGGAPTSDADGHFVVEHVGAGSGELMLLPKGGSFQPLVSKQYTAASGQRVELGEIKIVPPRDGDAGTLGMTTEVQGDALTVTMVQPDGPAANAGIVVGDKIVSIEGRAMSELTPQTAQKVLASGTIGAGQAVTLGLARGPIVRVVAQKW